MKKWNSLLYYNFENNKSETCKILMKLEFSNENKIFIKYQY